MIGMSATPHRTQMAVNALRLATTFGCGVFVLFAFGNFLDDAGRSLGLYLQLLGLRWVLAIPAVGLEASAVTALAMGQNRALRRLGVGISAVVGALTVLLLLFPLPIPGMIVAYAGVQAIIQCAMAPALARLLLGGRVGWHGGLVGLRRAADVIAVLAVLWSDGAIGFVGFLAIATGVMLGVTALAIGLATGTRVTPTRLARPLAPIVTSSLVITASQVISLRLPVLLITSVCAPDVALPSALAFVIAGYLRQAASVVLIGLDGLVARQRTVDGDHLRRVSLVFLVAMACLCVALVWATPFVVPAFLTGVGPAPDGVGLVSAIVMATASLRAWGDFWVKVLSGQAQQDRLQGAYLSAALVSVGLMATVVLAGPGPQVPTLIALVGLIVQAGLVLRVCKVAQRTEPPSVPSWTAG